MGFDGKCLAKDDPNVIWPYCPSLAASVLFTVLFGLTTIIHIIQAVRYRKGFSWVLIMGVAWETAAFILRTLSVRDQTNSTFYRLQYIIILVAPLWINAFDYMLLGRMIHFFLPGQKILGVKPRAVGILFVLLDIFAFFVQATGAAKASASKSGDTLTSTIKTGALIYTGGVALQQAFILFFLSLAVIFHVRAHRGQGAVHTRPTNWAPLLYTLYISLGLISLRVIYRIVEFSNLERETLFVNEVYAYVLDAVPMFLAAFVFNIMHPGRVLVGPESEFKGLSKEEKRAKREAKRAAKEEKKMAKQARKESDRGSDMELPPV